MGAWFPHGAAVAVRCRELGVYKLLGESSLECRNGAWSSRVPACVPTTLLTNYSGWAIAPEEREWKYRLSVYYSKPQDSGVFTCSTPRGITNSISVKVVAVHCEPLDVIEGNSGGVGSPGGGSVLSGGGVGLGGAARLPSIARIEGHRLGQAAFFHCPLGYILDGPLNLTCKASGHWSDRPPNCLAIRCPELFVDDPHLSIVEQNTSYGGRAVFRCSWGYVLTGPPGLECEATGRWSGNAPSCRLVECPPPLPPVNGRLLVEEEESDGPRGRRRRGRRTRRKTSPRYGARNGREAERRGGRRRRLRRSDRYAAGSAVQFTCSDGHQLIGESSILCTEGGVWSHPPPFCKVRCAYPGDPLNGRLAPLKFFYEPGDRIAVSCDAGFVARLPDVRPLCRPDGTWSEPTPSCRNYQEV